MHVNLIEKSDLKNAVSKLHPFPNLLNGVIISDSTFKYTASVPNKVANVSNARDR